jgi:hypothetical protein
MEFRLNPRLRTKYFLQLFTLPLLFYLLLVIPLALTLLVITPLGPWVSWIWFNTQLWGFILCFIWTIPGLILIPHIIDESIMQSKMKKSLYIAESVP